MAKPELSNQNDRFTAILKVAIIYLVTFILLTFIFRNCNKVPESEGIDNSGKMANFEKENDQLKTLVEYMDSISKTTRELVDYEKDPNASIVDVEDMERGISNLRKEFLGISFSEKIKEKEFISAKALLTEIDYYRKRINELKEKIIENNEDNEDKLKDQLGSKEAEYEAKIEALEDEVKGLEKQLDDCKDAGKSTAGSDKEKSEILQTVEEELKEATNKTDALLTSLKELRNENKHFNRNDISNLITSLENEIRALKTHIEGIDVK